MTTSMNDIDIAKEQQIRPIWRQAFRPFFLAGSVVWVITCKLQKTLIANDN